MKILAIDPGFDRIGIALFEKEKFKKETIIFTECFTTQKNEILGKRLYSIQEHLVQIFETYKPSHIAIESLFFTKNQKTALSVAEARGVMLAIAAKYNLQVHEYTPLQVKSAVGGYGKATKDQVEFMVYKMTGLSKQKRLDDEIDAIAIGLTCIAYERY